MEEQIIRTISTQIINLKKAVSGDYGWDIKIVNDNLEEAVIELEKINNQLKEKFPSVRSAGQRGKKKKGDTKKDVEAIEEI